MAIYKEDIVDINLETGNIHRSFLGRSIGTADSGADHFGVRVFRDGAAVSLSGVSVQGYFRDSHGNNIAITSGNSVSGNVAKVVLPQACYNYEGQFVLAIKLVGGGVTGTVRIVDGVVDNTNTGGAVAPTSTVPTYQEVLALYEQAIAVVNNSVRYNEAQSLTDAQKAQARENISATSVEETEHLKSALNSLATTAIIPVTYDVEKGMIDESGQDSQDGNQYYRRTSYIDLAHINSITINASTLVGYWYAIYTTSKEFVSPRVALTSRTVLDSLPSAGYIRIASYSGTITDESFVGGITIDGGLTYIQDELDDINDELDDISNEFDGITVKGFNLVPASTNGVGAAYNNGGTVKIETSSTDYHYVIVQVNKNTLYTVNAVGRFYILTDDNDTIISSGAFYKGYYIETGNATRLYYTVAEVDWTIGLIIAEGIHGASNNAKKPSFICEFNQLMDDSWFAVALTPGIVRFTKDIQEKFYYHNILALDTNTISLTFGGISSEKDNGVLINPSSIVIESNGYGYSVYDSNLSLVANVLRGARNRVSVYADNVQSCSALIIGDSIIAFGQIGQTLLDAFTERNKTITLLGTLGTGDNKNEGRPGWTSDDYFTNKQYQGVTNPFYNSTSETFDFSYYMTNQGYSSVDYVVIHIGANDLYNTPLEEARARIQQTAENVCDMIESIITFNANQKILIQLFSPVNTNSQYVSKVNQKLIRAKFANYNALMLLITTKYANVRCTNDYLILDPSTDISDNIHPNEGGMAKIGMEVFSQINCWQQQT